VTIYPAAVQMANRLFVSSRKFIGRSRS